MKSVGYFEVFIERALLNRNCAIILFVIINCCTIDIVHFLYFHAIYQSRFALRKMVYSENEERVEILKFERKYGNIDVMQFLVAMYHQHRRIA